MRRRMMGGRRGVVEAGVGSRVGGAGGALTISLGVVTRPKVLGLVALNPELEVTAERRGQRRSLARLKRKPRGATRRKGSKKNGGARRYGSGHVRDKWSDHVKLGLLLSTGARCVDLILALLVATPSRQVRELEPVDFLGSEGEKYVSMQLLQRPVL